LKFIKKIIILNPKHPLHVNKVNKKLGKEINLPAEKMESLLSSLRREEIKMR
jgi:hypothetical protein